MNEISNKPFLNEKPVKTFSLSGKVTNLEVFLA
jgi:hypothetical protein